MTVRLLVKGAGEPSLRAAGVDLVDRGRASTSLHELGWTEIDVPAGRAAAFEADLLRTGKASRVERPSKLDIAMTPNDPYYGQQWEHRVTDADLTWDRPTPEQVTIAVLDTGVNTGGDLSGRVLAGTSTVTGEPGTADVHGHGTMAGHVAAAAGNNSVGVAGVCWTCRILPVRVLAQDGSGWSTDLAAGIQWAVDNGADVISLSLSGTVESGVVSDAVAYALAAGVPVIAAAGNKSVTSPNYPAATAGVIGVAGTDPDDNLYSWSNRGSWVSVTAPGAPLVPFAGGVGTFAGTSAATPYVAGVIGRRKATGTAPAETPAQIRALVMATADPANAAISAGSGRINADRLVPSPAALPSAGARYTALTPARILDTRSGIGARAAKLGPGESLVLRVAGAGGVPASGAGAAVINVTVTEGTQEGYLSVYPDAASRPNSSSLNFTAGSDTPNLVTTRLTADGTAVVFNSAGYVHVIADVQGYFATGSTGGAAYTPLSPARVLDTREGIGAPRTALAADSAVELQMAGRGGVPADGSVSAVAINVTATDVTAGTYLTVWPTGVARPLASNLNVVAGVSVPNMVIVPVGTGASAGKVSIYNRNGQVAVVADVVGYFSSTGGSGFIPLTPARVLDTRVGVGAAGAVAGGTSINVNIADRAGVPPVGATGVVLNVTSTEASTPSWLAVWPADTARPFVSNLNFVGGQTIANLVIAKLSADGRVAVFNASGSTEVVADVVGYLR